MEDVKYPEAVEAFFAENPDATDCFEALGYAKATKEEAEKYLAGVKGKMVTRYVRNAGKMHEKDSDGLLELLIRFEEEEQKAHEDFDLTPTEDNMKAWKDAQANVAKAKAEYERILGEEKKETGGIVADGEVNTAEGDEVIVPEADVNVVLPSTTTEE